MYGYHMLSHLCHPQDAAALHWSRHHLSVLHWSLLCRLFARLEIIMWHLLVTIATSTNMKSKSPHLDPKSLSLLSASDRSLRDTLLRLMLLMLHATALHHFAWNLFETVRVT